MIRNDIKLLLKDRFSLREEKASEKATIAYIKGDVAFKGSHLWILIFAIVLQVLELLLPNGFFL